MHVRLPLSEHLTPDHAPSIELEQLSLGYGAKPAVRDLNLRIAPGTLLALMGPNGAGKSTLIKGIIGALRPSSGILRGPSRSQLAALAQRPGLDLSFPISVRGMVAMGLWRQLGFMGRMKSHHHQRLEEALDQVGLTHLGDHNLNALSGGQVQRALFARLILQDAPVVVLDEPFAAIDPTTTADLQALLHQWHGQGKTVIVALHDFAHVRAHFPQTLLLATHQVANGPTAEVLTEANWRLALQVQNNLNAWNAQPADPPKEDEFNAMAHRLAEVE